MIRRLGKTCLLGLSLWLAVGPLAILQLGAWSWMIASYSQESSFEQAIRETFGDERPCELCRLIDTVEEERESSAPLPSKKDFQSLKLMLGLEQAVKVPTPTFWLTSRISENWLYQSVRPKVPTTPPRSA